MVISTTVGQRFSGLISHLGISKNAFANSLEKTATVIQHIVDERNKPGFDLLCKVFEVYPNVSKDWLLQGSGPMLAADPLFAANAIRSEPVAEGKAAGYKTAATAVAIEPDAAPAPKASPPPNLAPPVPATPLVAPEPMAMPVPVVEAIASVAALPSPIPAAAAPDASWQTALYTQQMAHQLAMAELRNQHLLDQQRMMQQMLDLMKQQMSK